MKEALQYTVHHPVQKSNPTPWIIPVMEVLVLVMVLVWGVFSLERMRHGDQGINRSRNSTQQENSETTKNQDEPESSLSSSSRRRRRDGKCFSHVAANSNGSYERMEEATEKGNLSSSSSVSLAGRSARVTTTTATAAPKR